MRPEQQRELLRLLGVLPSEEPVEPEEPTDPDFDGGVRQSAPSTHPAEDHNAVVAQLLQEARWTRWRA